MYMRQDDFSDWSKEDLVKEIKKLKKRKKFGLVWDEEKTKEKFDKDSVNKLPILKEIKSKEIQTDKDSSSNILIEGDNYDALSVLNYTHKGQIDVIYIDPPYNTGNQFQFNDDIVDASDPYRHSKWLTFMFKRLLLAKQLLKKNGTIFISIDDNEQPRIRMLCEEIFGEKNFISQIIVQTNKGGRDYLEIANTHEYLLCFGRSEDVKLHKLPKDISSLRYNDSLGIYDIRELRNRNPKFNKENRPNLFYSIFVNPKIKDEYNHCAISLKKTNEYNIEVLPRNKEGKDGCWRWGKKKLLENIILNIPKKSEVIAKKRRDGGWNIYEKDRNETSRAKSIWDETDIRSERGTIVLRQILKKPLFDFPKPVELIIKCLKLSTEKNSIILDFFAGSGTTGHAVLELNKEDKGNRQFILCTNNEGNICTNVCYPRIQKIIDGYTNIKNEKIKGLNANLKYFKTDFVEGESTDKNKKKLVDQCTEMLCLKEDCFDELKQTKNYSIFKNHEEKYFGIVYDDDGIEPLKKQIKSTGKKFNVYVFSLDDSAREEEFEDVKGMVDLKPIPEVILNVYRRIFK